MKRLAHLLLLAALTAQGQSVNLLERYPTKLTEGDSQPDHARSWDFTGADLFRLSGFTLGVGSEFRVETGPANLGIGHCTDGAVWAVVIPRESGRLVSQARSQEEPVAHVWLRFHPREINHLFQPGTVSAEADRGLEARVRGIAEHKFTSSWHAGGQAMIPEPKDMTVDVDTKGGPRRFFVVDTQARTAKYIPAFAGRPVKAAPSLTPELAERAFDQLWEAFDRDYALFALRPEVDWAELRDDYRPKALQCKTTEEFARVCAEMLKPLRDLHVWLTVAGRQVPVFNRPRSANSNPSAHRAILGDLNRKGSVQWAVTTNGVGYLAISGWSDPAIPGDCDAVLEEVRDLRGLILDVRLNGGGSEDLAREVAGRFVPREFVYAYSQFRNGPSHTNLTALFERRVGPRGPWRYQRPVVVLIGQKCMSSNESFVAMMSGDPEAVIMGDHTCGSSGNPEIVQLPLDMTVSVPRWIDYLPDATPLDERGFQPHIRFDPNPGAFAAHRDELLSAALERLRAGAR